LAAAAQGEQILGTYLYGRGKPHTVSDDPQWSAYMMANDGLRCQIFGQLILVVKDIDIFDQIIAYAAVKPINVVNPEVLAPS
jgi:hypothetical protein